MVDLNTRCRHVLAVAGALGLEGVRLRADLAEDLPPLWAVQLQLEQVVLQLVSTPMQAMQEQPGPRDLTVRTYPGGLGVVLQVDDTGPGISPEHLDRIFDPFWTTRRPGEGTGLGLSLVHGIVEDHGGRIRVDSCSGAGPSFAVELPVARSRAGGPRAGGGRSPRRPAPPRSSWWTTRPPSASPSPATWSGAATAWRRPSEGGEALALLDARRRASPTTSSSPTCACPASTASELLRRLRQRGDGLEERLIFITGDADSPDVDRGAGRRRGPRGAEAVRAGGDRADHRGPGGDGRPPAEPAPPTAARSSGSYWRSAAALV